MVRGEKIKMNLLKNPLEPRKVIDINGKVAYSEGAQAWNIIQLKKEIFSEFPQLREKRSKFSYKIMFSRDYDSFKEIAKKMKDERVMPILMWIYKEE